MTIWCSRKSHVMKAMFIPKRMFTTGLIALGVVFGFLWADEPQISLSSGVDKSRITIGDLITYTVEVTHDKNVKVEMPGMGANLGGFEIRDYRVHEPKIKGDKQISRWDYVISTFFTGEFEIPPLTITYTTPGDSTAKTLTTDKITIVVESVKPSEAGDIRDIKPPVEIPSNLWQQVRWFVVCGGLIGLAILGYVFYRRWKAGKGLLLRETPPRPPHEVALERLDILKDSDLLEKGEIKPFYSELSEIIRQYIEGRYYMVAMEMTTTEIRNGLLAAEVSKEEHGIFETILDRSDLVKFAKRIPSAEENEEVLDLAYEIIHRTKVILEEAMVENSEGTLEEKGVAVEAEDSTANSGKEIGGV